MRLNVEIVDAINKDGLIVITFVQDDNYFQIQDSSEYDQQDINLGMNQYYIEFNGQQFGCYGGINMIGIKDNSLI